MGLLYSSSVMLSSVLHYIMVIRGLPTCGLPFFRCLLYLLRPLSLSLSLVYRSSPSLYLLFSNRFYPRMGLRCAYHTSMMGTHQTTMSYGHDGYTSGKQFYINRRPMHSKSILRLTNTQKDINGSPDLMKVLLISYIFPQVLDLI